MSDTGSQSELIELMGNSPMAHMLVDSDGGVLYVNKVFSQLTGYTIEDMEHINDWLTRISWNPVQAEDYKRQWQEWRSCLGPVNIIWTISCKDCTLRHLTLSIAFMNDGRAMMALQDETNRIRLEKELKDNQEKQTALSKATFEAVLIMDKGYILECNQAALDMFDYPRKQLVGMYCTDLMADGFRAITASHIMGSQDTPCEVVAVRRDGATFPAELQSRVFTYRQRSVRATVIRDITDRKTSERVPYTLYAISNAISTIRDLDLLYQSVHDILHKAIGANNFFIAIIDKDYNRLTFPYFKDELDDDSHVLDIDNPETKSLSLFVIRSGLPLFVTGEELRSEGISQELGIIGPEPAVWMGVPLKPHGVITGVMAVQHYQDPHFYTQADLDLFETVASQVAVGIERLMAEEELSRLNNELERMVERRTEELTRKASELEMANARLKELDKIKSNLLSSVSHEMRTPLTSIRGFASVVARDFSRHFQHLAENDRLAQKARRIHTNLDIVTRESDRMARLINDFLNLSRIESGHMEWNDAPLDLSLVLHQAVEAVMGEREEQRDVSLTLDLEPDMPPLHADRDKIQQVFINLLHNAVKFTPRGEVGLEARHADGMVSVKVWDTGIGIPVEERERIFEKFHQFRPQGKPPGTGLGLAITKQIIEHYQGEIRVSSSLGKGSVFTVSLPCMPPSFNTMPSSGIAAG